MAVGRSACSTCNNSVVFLLSYKIPLALTISEYTKPHPISLQSTRNGKSVTPAIGAKKMGLSNFTLPIYIVVPPILMV